MHSSFRRLGKRTAWLLSSVAVLGLVLSGSAFAASHAAKPTAKAQKLTTVKIQLNWEKNVEFSGLWIADHFGWLKKAGFKIDATAWANGIDPEGTTMGCYQTGSTLCVGFDDSAAVAIARAAGEDLKAIWVGSQKTPFGLATCAVTGNKKIDAKCKSKTHKNITKPKQLKGLTIGYQSHELYVLEVMLATAHLGLKDVKLVDVVYNTDTLISGTVDAYEAFDNNEPIAWKLQGVHVNTIPAYQYGMKDFYADAMFAPSSELKAHASQMKSFVRIVDKGWKWAMHNSKAAADIVEQHYFKYCTPTCAFNVKQQRLEAGLFASIFSRDNKGRISGQMSLSRWKGIIHVLRTSPATLGGGPILTKNISAAQAYTNNFAPPPSK